VKLAIRLVPRGLQERARPHVDRFQALVREFEWTWTKAVVASLALWFLAIGLIAFIPSWWLYFADQKLGWHRCPCPTTLKFFLFKARDVVAIILFSIPFGGFIMIPYHLQKLRRRLRSESESRPTGGYR
jgi:TRAP-type C4-dicarboxylate transport system permease small subunit